MSFWPAKSSYKSLNVCSSDNLCDGWHPFFPSSKTSPPILPDFSHEDQIHHPHQHAMQQIRWERRAQFGSTRKKWKRNLKKCRQLSCTTALHRRLGRAPRIWPKRRPISLGWDRPRSVSKNVRLGYFKLTPCITIGGMKDNFVSDTFRHFFGQKWHLSHQNTQLKAYFG